MDIYSAPFPHCDETVLHKPQECVCCDHYPALQNARINNAIPFSGEGGSPDEEFRSREAIDRWGGNRAVKCNHLPVQNRGAETDDGSFLCFLCKSWVQPESIWDEGMGALGDVPGRVESDDIGCQVNLITGEHYGPCKGSCRPEKAPLQALSEYLENEAHRWETDPRSGFRDGVVSGYRWAKAKLDEVIENDESN